MWFYNLNTSYISSWTTLYGYVTLYHGCLQSDNIHSPNKNLYLSGRHSCTDLQEQFCGCFGILSLSVVRLNIFGLIAVRPNNQHLLVNDKSYSCSDEVPVYDTTNDVMLKCSVESKPQATFTWSTNPALSGSLLNFCVQDQNSLVYTCTTTLTLPRGKVFQTDKVVITCHAEAAGNTIDTCVTLSKSIIYVCLF